MTAQIPSNGTRHRGNIGKKKKHHGRRRRQTAARAVRVAFCCGCGRLLGAGREGRGGSVREVVHGVRFTRRGPLVLVVHVRIYRLLLMVMLLVVWLVVWLVVEGGGPAERLRRGSRGRLGLRLVARLRARLPAGVLVVGRRRSVGLWLRLVL